jgi:hypothetical protein
MRLYVVIGATFARAANERIDKLATPPSRIRSRAASRIRSTRCALAMITGFTRR